MPQEDDAHTTQGAGKQLAVASVTVNDGNMGWKTGSAADQRFLQIPGSRVAVSYFRTQVCLAKKKSTWLWLAILIRAGLKALPFRSQLGRLGLSQPSEPVERALC